MNHKTDSDEGLEFHITDFGDARQVLDEVPAGVNTMAARDPGYWLRRRRPPIATDRALTGPAMDWVMQLPAALQPRRTSVLFPRLVNAMAAAAHDLPALQATIAALLDDRRGGRRGLPLQVQQELTALQAHVGTRLAPGRSHDDEPTQDLARARELLEAAGYRIVAPIR